ncbi:MAG: hypothetical protein U9R25_01905 [Chloroflexota bacterium]|nr:hypothetical protein [Chloroflexota bacterium]
MMILAVGSLFVFWVLAVTVFLFSRPVGQLGWRLLPLFIPFWLLALWLIPRSLTAAQIVWQAGLAATILLTIYLFRAPEFAFFLALLPLMGFLYRSCLWCWYTLYSADGLWPGSWRVPSRDKPSAWPAQYFYAGATSEPILSFACCRG